VKIFMPLANELSTYASFAGAFVSLLAAGVTLYLGRQSLRVQADLKRLEADLKQREARRGRVERVVQSVQRYRLELYQTRVWARQALEQPSDAAYLKSFGEQRSGQLSAAMDKLIEAWSDARVDLPGQHATNLAAGFHDSRQPYAMVSMMLALISREGITQERRFEILEGLKGAVSYGLEALDGLELIAREALTNVDT
jgi:hypothetical protein